MTCEEARLRMADEAGRAECGPELDGHLKSCRLCELEAAEFRQTWQMLGSLPQAEPAPWVSTRFYAALNAYEQGRTESVRAGWVARWWPSKPAWQAVISCACLLVGLGGGYRLAQRAPETSDGTEISQMRKEMAGMRQLVTLSLLQQQSATERLRGVTWSYRAEPEDTQVLSALLQTVTADPSPDVRLAAVDALRNLGHNSTARRGLVQALQRQDSPLVQLAIVDALTDLKERSATPALQQLVRSGDVDENVRKRASQALSTFH
ncbi:MAG TPA: HEAT repeat domain-containing protein [Bryobacteraceae bacterium]|nr:HEAT repeat domain-containing protein [Bryobacteraceae bacterium]